MSHRNMVATVAGVMTAVPNLSTKDVYLAYLPLAHVLEIAAEVCPIYDMCLVRVLQCGMPWLMYLRGPKLLHSL